MSATGLPAGSRTTPSTHDRAAAGLVGGGTTWDGRPLGGVGDIDLGGVDVLIPHQVNGRIIDAALESTGFPPDKVMVNLDKYGNTSAASVPIALDEALRTGRCKPGDTVLLVAFGGGLTWSSAIITL